MVDNQLLHYYESNHSDISKQWQASTHTYTAVKYAITAAEPGLYGGMV